MPPRFRVLLVFLTACTSPLGAARTSLDGPSSLVVAQIHPGGGNLGATYREDFVVVQNRGDVPIALTGLSLQYTSAGSTRGLGAVDATRTALPDRTLAPGERLLVLGAAGMAGAAVPDPDVVDATPLALSASGGVLALVHGVEPLGCNGTSSPCDATARARVLDLVGWGDAGFAEGTRAPAPATGDALHRLGGGCIDTEDNRADFTRQAADPDRTRAACGGAPDAGLDEDAGADAGLGDAGIAPPDASAEPTIGLLQGRSHVSPWVGRSVSALVAVVTARFDGGFYVEGLVDDGDPATSNGLRVQSRSAVGVGDLVRLAGRIVERRPGCARCGPGDPSYANLSVTTLETSTPPILLGRAPLPAPVRVGLSGRVPPQRVLDDDTVGDVESGATLFDPAHDGLDFHESLEGMRVALDAATVVGPTRGRGTSAETVVVVDGLAGPRSPRGGLFRPDDGSDANPERFVLVARLGAGPVAADVGDVLPRGVLGVVDYDRGRYELLPTGTPMLEHTALGAERVWLPAHDGPFVDVATFNVHNLSAKDDATRFAELAETIVSRLDSPDVLVVQEMQDDSGSTDDGTTSALGTAARLIDAIRAAEGPTYVYVDVPPADGEDGGRAGANIRVGLFVAEDGPVHLTLRGSASADTPVGIVTTDDGVHLDASPARIDPADPAFAGSRKPLVVELATGEGPLFVVGVHAKSRVGDPPDQGRYQPPPSPTEAQRRAQGDAVARLVSALLASDPAAAVLVLGDFNDPPKAASLRRLGEVGLVDLAAGVPEDERATYVYLGEAEPLDHVFGSPFLAERLVGADVVHGDADRAAGTSDHDAVVVRLALGGLAKAPPSPPPRPSGATCGARTAPPNGWPGALLAALVLLAVRRARSRRAELE